MRRRLATGVLALVAICFAPPLSAALEGQPDLSAAQKRGSAFAVRRCSACHAVMENRTSPNPEAPSFEDIVNRSGVTAATLRPFLRDSHNYPAAMNFRVERGEIDDLSEFIVTLKKQGYRPVM
jgi:cytochrome c2